MYNNSTIFNNPNSRLWLFKTLTGLARSYRVLQVKTHNDILVGFIITWVHRIPNFRDVLTVSWTGSTGVMHWANSQLHVTTCQFHPYLSIACPPQFTCIVLSVSNKEHVPLHRVLQPAAHEFWHTWLEDHPDKHYRDTMYTCINKGVHMDLKDLRSPSFHTTGRHVIHTQMRYNSSSTKINN